VTDEFALAPRTSVDIGPGAEITETPVYRVGSWLLYQARIGANLDWVHEYFPQGLVTRGADNAPRLIISRDDAVAAWKIGQERFDALAEALRDIRHPGVLTVTDRSPPGQGPLLIAGPFDRADTSIASHLAQKKRFSPNGVMVLAAQISDALVFIHSRDLLHRDIRPQTVVLRERQALLTNFAIDERLYMRVLGSKVSLVHPPYSPIELYDDRSRDSVTPASDIYSACAMLYELITQSPAPAWRALAERADLPEFLTARDYPPAFLKAVAKGLATEPEHAFSAAEEWRKEMAVGGMALAPSGWFVAEKPRRRGMWPIVGGAVVLALVAAAAIWILHLAQVKPPPLPRPVEHIEAPAPHPVGPTKPSETSAKPVPPPEPAPPQPAPTPEPEPPPVLTPDALTGAWRVGDGPCDHRIAWNGDDQIKVKVAGVPDPFRHHLTQAPSWNPDDKTWSLRSTMGEEKAIYAWTVGTNGVLSQAKVGSREASEVWRLCPKRKGR
jgi:serine/threonine protein kinase